MGKAYGWTGKKWGIYVDVLLVATFGVHLHIGKDSEFVLMTPLFYVSIFRTEPSHE